MGVKVYRGSSVVEVIDTAPVVIPPPPPPPPVVVANVTINRQTLTPTGNYIPALAFFRWTTIDRYQRFQSLLTLNPAGDSLRMIGIKLFDGGTIAVGSAPINVVMTPVNGATGAFGTPIALPPFTPAPTATSVFVPTPALAPGWYRCTATAGTWQVPAFYVYVPGGALPSVMPVMRANWELEHPWDGAYRAADCIVPTTYAPVTVPYPARTFPALTGYPTRSTCVETQLVPCRAADVYRPVRAAANAQQPEGGSYSPRPAGVAGLVTSFNRQCYFYFDMIGREVPILPLLDGPRGVGTVNGAQHLQVGRNGKVYFADNYRIGRIDVDGTITTLVGWRHKTPTLWTDTPADLELVGDWSAVPGPKSINECWGMAWDARTLATDPAAAPIGGEQPHVTGPTLYFPDRNHNRVLKATFSATVRNAPAVVTLFKVCAEPWECVSDGANRLFVSERAANRIAIYNMDDGALLGTISMPSGFPYPEGLYYWNGTLYYACVSMNADGSLSGGQIRKRTDAGVDTLFVALTTPWLVDGNSRFAKIAVSTDGTFGPPGLLALSTWSGNGYSYPLLFRPDGSNYNSNNSQWPGDDPNGGPGLPWHRGSAYSTASAFGQGRFVCSTMQEGIRVISKALPTDVNLATAGYNAGRADYLARGFNLAYGDDGWSFNGVQPWGVTSDIDQYMSAQGHIKP